MSNQSYTVGLFVGCVAIRVCNLVYLLDHISMTTGLWVIMNQITISSVVLTKN